jgi:hypothetical protein
MRPSRHHLDAGSGPLEIPVAGGRGDHDSSLTRALVGTTSTQSASTAARIRAEESAPQDDGVSRRAGERVLIEVATCPRLPLQPPLGPPAAPGIPAWPGPSAGAGGCRCTCRCGPGPGRSSFARLHRQDGLCRRTQARRLRQGRARGGACQAGRARAGHRTVVVPGGDPGEGNGLADGLPGAGDSDRDSETTRD